MDKLIQQVIDWHYARNLIHGSNDLAQFAKLVSEVGELADNIAKGRDIKDDVGDILVVLINIVERNEITLGECLQVAYNDIKDRRGKMVDGVFIKEGDTV